MTGADRLARLRLRLSEERRGRRLATTTARILTPPPRDAYGRFGEGTWVVPPARVSTPEAIFLGDDVIIHEHAWLSVVSVDPGTVTRLTIGDRTSIGRMAHIACIGEIEIGSDVLTAERIFIGDTYHGYEDPDRPVLDQPMASPQKVTIGRGAFLGIGSVVLLGVTVGEQAYVAAGAVVTKDVEPRTLVVGNPARAVQRWDAALDAWVPVTE